MSQSKGIIQHQQQQQQQQNQKPQIQPQHQPKRRPSGVLWQLRHQLHKRSTRKMKTIS
ncbi:GL10301 [Drosophila persimilis]|uniref:GL10301 n=1 Tax=Drosophila persimilis TaxID=7234 RepID=B4H9G8_DROPE|nr:GL10301 [Drosophila persimilis]